MAKSWTSQQLDAMNTKDRDILVSAAAGSGKTAVLVERIVNKITKENGTDIDRLVVVTFTKAAAAEMKARVRNRLDDMLDEDEKNSNLIKQIALINNAQITTIDSFCLWILKNHFSEINLDPGFRVADKGEITLLENDVMQDMLEDYYKESDEQFLALIDAYGTGRSDANIEEIIKKIYVLARSNPWPDEWYEQVIDTYTGMDNSNNKVLVNLYESIQCSARDYKRKYEYMIELCGRVDGPISYLDAIKIGYRSVNPSTKLNHILIFSLIVTRRTLYTFIQIDKYLIIAVIHTCVCVNNLLIPFIRPWITSCKHIYLLNYLFDIGITSASSICIYEC